MNGPIFQTQHPNEDVTLHAGTLRLIGETNSIEGTGVVKLIWSPTPLIAFDMDLGPAEQTIDWFDQRRLLLVELGVEGECAWIRRSPEVEGKARIHGVLRGGIPSFGRSNDLDSVSFHVVGFWPLWHDQLEMECSGWVATLCNVPNAAEPSGIGKRLQDEGGFGITHWGRLRRKDGSTFEAEAAQKCLEQVGMLLSFARGAWCIPMLLVGVRAGGQVQWQSWNPKRANRWPQTPSWFDEHKRGQLEAILPGLCARMLTPPWEEAIRLAIYWYVESLSGVQNAETSVVLSLVALERLAWAYIVESRAHKKKLGNTTSATDKLRVLLNGVQIPASLPKDLDEAMAKGEPSTRLDGPATFVEILNLVVHPRGGLLATPKSDRRQAKDLGLWYLELVLLSLFGYRGQYCNRLLDHKSGGRWEVVPWAKT